MLLIHRRHLIALGLPLLVGAVPVRPALAHDDALWTFDSLETVGGRKPALVGTPRLTASPWGQAIAFDGIGDALILDHHPLAGASTFTFEALFRPDGGAFQQRWFHLESVMDGQAEPGLSSTRMMFEIRVTGERWYLDAFVTGPGYKQPLAVPAMTWPVGQWHHVAQSYDGRTYRSFVNGEMQAAVDIPFVAQGPGRTSVGARLNRVDFFRGAVRAAHFSRAALLPSRFHLLPAFVRQTGRDPA